MRKYLTFQYYIEIKAIEIERETEHYIFWLQENWRGMKTIRRQAKSQHYHDTWEAAHDYLRERTLAEIDSLTKRLDGAKHDLTVLEHMTDPEERGEQ